MRCRSSFLRMRDRRWSAPVAKVRTPHRNWLRGPASSSSAYGLWLRSSSPGSCWCAVMPESGAAESSGPQGWAARSRFRTYTAYSIGCAIVWAVLLIVVETGGDTHKRSDLLFVFLG